MMKLLLTLLLFYLSQQKIGEEFVANKPTTSLYQIEQDIKPLKNGGFVVTYNTEKSGIWKYYTKASTFDSEGNFNLVDFMGDPFGKTKFSHNARNEQLENENVTVVWRDELDREYIYGQIYSSETGDATLEDMFVVTMNATDSPEISKYNDGFYVLFKHETLGLVARKFNNTGFPLELIQITTVGMQTLNYIIKAWNDGSFLVVFDDGSDSYGAFVDMYGSVGPYQLLNQHTSNRQTLPQLAIFNDNSFFVVWNTVNQFHSNDIVGRYFENNNGVFLGQEEILMNQEYLDSQYSPFITNYASDYIVVAWNNGNYQIQAMIADKMGNRIGNDVNVKTTEVSTGNFNKLSNVRLTSLVDNKLVFTWQAFGMESSLNVGGSGYGIHAIVEAPRVIKNSFSVVEDTIKPLNASEFAIGFDFIFSNQFMIYVQNVKGFRFLDKTLQETTHFTKEELENGHVYVKHISMEEEDQEEMPSFNLMISTPFYSTEWENMQFGLIRTNDNPPMLKNFGFTIKEGETIEITEEMIEISDADKDTTDSQLIFHVNMIKNGNFVHMMYPVTSFSLADIKNGEISFQHDGTTMKPEFEVKVSDGDNDSDLLHGNIVFYRVPVLSISKGNTITREEKITLTLQHFTVSNIDVEDFELCFLISGLMQGAIYVDGMEKMMFTLEDLKYGRVVFMHKYNNSEPKEKYLSSSFSVQLFDGMSFYSNKQLMEFTLEKMNKHIPILSRFDFSIKNNETIYITEDMIDVSDADIDQEKEDLMIHIEELEHGMFKTVMYKLSSFTIQNIRDLNVMFVHDGSSIAPHFKAKVSDGENESDFIDPTIMFYRKPILEVVSGMNITKREEIKLSLQHIFVLNQDVKDTEIVFMVSELKQCSIYLMMNDKKMETEMFTLEDLKYGRVSLIHNYNESIPMEEFISPSIQIKAYDGMSFYSEEKQLSFNLLMEKKEEMIESNNLNDSVVALSIGFSTIALVLLIISVVAVVVLSTLVCLLCKKSKKPAVSNSDVKEVKNEMEKAKI